MLNNTLNTEYNNKATKNISLTKGVWSTAIDDTDKTVNTCDETIIGNFLTELETTNKQEPRQSDINKSLTKGIWGNNVDTTEKTVIMCDIILENKSARSPPRSSKILKKLGPLNLLKKLICQKKENSRRHSLQDLEESNKVQFIIPADISFHTIYNDEDDTVSCL